VILSLITLLVATIAIMSVLLSKRPWELGFMLKPRFWSDPKACASCHNTSFFQTDAALDEHHKLNCTSCHWSSNAEMREDQTGFIHFKNWFRHVRGNDDLADKEKRVKNISANCLNCHTADLQDNKMHLAIEQNTQVTCLSCHGSFVHPTPAAKQLFTSMQINKVEHKNFTISQCLNCHSVVTPEIVEEHVLSRHGSKVNCTQCHTDNHGKIEQSKGQVSISNCAACHKSQTEQFLASPHGKSAEGLNRAIPYHFNSRQIEPQKCYACHRIGVAEPWDKQATQCLTCHQPHRYQNTVEESANSCMSCHSGPDYSVAEMWKSNVHGKKWIETGGKEGATCVSCHQVGTHDVSEGLVYQRIEAGLSDDALEKIRNDYVQKACFKCHEQKVVRDFLVATDDIAERAKDIMDMAEFLIMDLYKNDMLEPLLAEVSPHPITGKILQLGDQMHDDPNYPKILKLYYRMRKYHLKGIYLAIIHADPDKLGQYGWKGLHEDYVELLAEYNRIKAQFEAGTNREFYVNSALEHTSMYKDKKDSQ